MKSPGWREAVVAALSLLTLGCAGGVTDSATLTAIGRCLAHQAPAYDEAVNQSLNRLSPELLTTQRFAVFSHVYPSQPADGYPIRFLPDGSIAGTQYDGYRWSVTERGLEVTAPGRSNTRVFSFDRECVSLTHRRQDEANPMLQIEIAVVE